MNLFRAGILLLVFATVSQAADKKPNVLFLFTDDQRADAVGALGNPAIKTPNLDKLVQNGFVFRNAYCLGANVGAVCTPSRNMLLSGRAYFRWKGPMAPNDGPNFPDAMNAAGYETYHHGKRGNTAGPIQEKFTHNKYTMETRERTSGQPGKTIVDTAIAFLKERKNEKPFFMYLAFESPHDPRVADKEYLALYDRDKLPLPKNYLPQHPFDNGEMTVRDEKLAPWPRSEAEIRKHLHEYYAVMSGLDAHIGRLLKALKDLQLSDDTIIVFSSDHGLALGSHGLMGKQSLYEHSMKSPLVFSGAGIAKGESDALVYLFDIFPTVCSLTGAKLPEKIDGKSLEPILSKKQTKVRDTVFLSYRDVQRAVRDERWKLLRFPQVNKTLLFDLKNDPDEMKSLADDPKYADEVKRLTKVMEQWQKDLGDTAPLVVDKPKDPNWTPPKP